jgi:hypothetical protein
MKFKLIISNIGLVFIFSSLLFGCTRYYHHTPNHTKKQQELQGSKNREVSTSDNQISKSNEWIVLVTKNHIVIHHGDEMLDLFSIRYDESTDSIKCLFRSFEGKPLDYYNEVSVSRTNGSRIIEKPTTRDNKQVHLFMNSFDKLSSSEIAFSIKDIFQVDVTEKADYLNALVSAGLISKNNEWRNLESQNRIVFHNGDEMLEIYSIRYNENTDSIKCFSRPFEGKPLEYYNKVLAKRSGNTKLRNKSSRSDIQQAHLFINSFDKLSGSEIAFSIKDISQVGVIKQAVGRNILASVGAVGIGVGSFIMGFIVVCLADCCYCG